MGSLLSDSGKVLLASVAGRLVSLFTLPLLTKSIAPESYGVANLAGSLIGLFGVFGLMGMDMAYAREYFAKDGQANTAVADFCWRFVFVTGTVASIMSAAAWFFLAHDAALFVRLGFFVACGTCGSATLAIALTRARLHGQSARLALATLAAGASPPCISLILVALHVEGSAALVAGFAAAYFVAIAVAGVPKPNWRSTTDRLSVSRKIEIVKVGLPGLITAPAYWALSSSDRWFLDHYADLGDVGKYAVSASVALSGLMINSAILSLWFPALAKRQGSREQLDSQFINQHIPSLILFFALTWLLVSSFGNDAINFLADRRYLAPPLLVPLLAGGSFFYGCYHALNSGLFIARKMAWSAIAMAIGVVISVVSNFVLVPRLGMVGAAVSQLAGFSASACAVMIFSFGLGRPNRTYSLLAFKILAIFVAGLLLNFPWSMQPLTSALLKVGPFLLICAAVIYLQFGNIFDALPKKGAN